MKVAQRVGAIKSIAVIDGAYAVLRALEYMVLRTDQSMFGEAFVHKLAWILILALAARRFSFDWRDTIWRRMSRLLFYLKMRRYFG